MHTVLYGLLTDSGRYGHLSLITKNKHFALENTTPTTKTDQINRQAEPAVINSPLTVQCAVQNTPCRRNVNRGFATVEAVCILPMFLIAFWILYSMCQMFIVDNLVYQAVMNTAEELAEYAYLVEEDSMILDTVAANGMLQEYLPSDKRLERYVKGGKAGLLILYPVKMDAEGFFTVRLNYRLEIPAPFFKNLGMPIQIQVRQKAYTGYQKPSEEDNEGAYVYLAENGTVYHLTRDCSHLNLTIRPVGADRCREQYAELTPCEYCGDEAADVYYITDTGERYHTSMECGGLKRTVRRVPLSDAQGYAPCSRCGKE